MNAERLLAHYERVADAPDAIARLRRFILDLAVRGKLVPQDPQDEPASELLKRNRKGEGESSRSARRVAKANGRRAPRFSVWEGFESQRTRGRRPGAVSAFSRKRISINGGVSTK